MLVANNQTLFKPSDITLPADVNTGYAHCIRLSSSPQTQHYLQMSTLGMHNASQQSMTRQILHRQLWIAGAQCRPTCCPWPILSVAVKHRGAVGYPRSPMRPHENGAPFLLSSRHYVAVTQCLLCSSQHSVQFLSAVCRVESSYILLPKAALHCREAGSEDELQKLRMKYDKSEAARHDLEKRVRASCTMQKRLLTACTVG